MQSTGSTGTLSTQVPTYKGLPPYLERQVDVPLIVPTGTISDLPHTFNTQVPYSKCLPPYNKHPGSYIKWFTTYPNYPGSYIVYF